jgi:hypothetical protein
MMDRGRIGIEFAAEVAWPVIPVVVRRSQRSKEWIDPELKEQWLPFSVLEGLPDETGRSAALHLVAL